jgi:hypothetical protein
MRGHSGHKEALWSYVCELSVVFRPYSFQENCLVSVDIWTRMDIEDYDISKLTSKFKIVSL